MRKKLKSDFLCVCVFVLQRGPVGPRGPAGPPGVSGVPGVDGIDVSRSFISVINLTVQMWVRAADQFTSGLISSDKLLLIVFTQEGEKAAAKSYENKKHLHVTSS